jgi:hypothetical protein
VYVQHGSPVTTTLGGPKEKLFMKTNFVRQIGIGLAAGLAVFPGCARPSAGPDQATAAVTPVQTYPVIAAAGVAPATADANDAGAAPAAGTNAPAIMERIPPTAKPENVAITPGLSEVVKLAQAGVGEEVIVAYVEKYSGRFDVGADQILYLNDLGVPSTIITSMLKHDGSDAAAVAAASANPPSAPTNVPQTQVVEPSAPVQVATSVAPPPTSTEVSYFYDSLSPYGSWVYLSGYGWCWQPTVAVSVSTWRPYCDRGRWYWSDGGWYWYSDYSWGWATFHYGRWYRHPGCGWVWTPGLVWAPSWVSWRYADGYCGWAPLPPEAHFVAGVGFTHFGRHVSVGFDFGLTDVHYSFVHINNFCDYAPYRYVVPHTQVRNFYRNTTVINNYIVGNNNTVINQGLGRETIARAGTTRIREVSIKETQVRNVASIRGDRIEKQGNQMVVYRPQLPKTPPPVRTAQFTTRAREQTASVGRTANVGGNVNTTATTPAGTGRAQNSVAARSSTSGTVEPSRPQQTEERQGRAAGNQRGNGTAAVERNAVRSAQPNTTAPQPRSQQNAVPSRQQQPRANTPLFGPGTSTAQQQGDPVVRTIEPRNTPAPATRAQPQSQTAVPRGQSQVRNDNAGRWSPPARVYSGPPAAPPQVQQPAGRRETRGVVRSYSDHSVMSPKQYEQTPRAVTPYQAPRAMPYQAPAPAYQAPARTAPQYSAPASAPTARSAPEHTRAAPAASGGNAQGGGREGRAERSERNR